MRCDGARGGTYAVDDGLPDRRVNDWLVSRTGDYWLATHEGCAAFSRSGRWAGLPHRVGDSLAQAG